MVTIEILRTTTTTTTTAADTASYNTYPALVYFCIPKSHCEKVVFFKLLFVNCIFIVKERSLMRKDDYNNVNRAHYINIHEWSYISTSTKMSLSRN